MDNDSRKDGASPVADESAPASAGSSATGFNIEKPGSCWSRFHVKINEYADICFYRLGYCVATNTKLTLLISLLLVSACCFGFANFRVESDADDLWIPSNSLAKRQQSVVFEAFELNSDYALLLMESPVDGGSVLTKESMDALWELDALVWSIESDGNTYADLCITELDGTTCRQPFRGVTHFWGNSVDAYNASVTSDADVLAAINVEFFPNGQAVILEAVFGSSITYDDAGDVSGATAMLQSYWLGTHSDEEATITEDVSTWQNVYSWQAEYQDTFKDTVDGVSVFNLKYITGRSLDDAMMESIYGEMFLYVITYCTMIAFVMTALGRCWSGPVRRRSWLGLAGVLLVVAAGLAGYGINSAFGVPFTMLASMLPFILIGIGVDDMFVIVAAFDHTDPTLPVEERIALGVKRCGVSVTYTSLTNFLAFMLGSTSSLPAVVYFCFYAAVCILFDFFLQMTAFVALLTMDAHRQKAGKIDWCFCCTHKKYIEEDAAIQGGAVLPAAERGGAKGGKNQAHGDMFLAEVHHLTAVGSFMKEKYTPWLLSKMGKVLVLLGTGSLFFAGIYGVTQATQGFDMLDLAPDDHYARDYTELARKHELEIDTQYLQLGVYTRDVDYQDITVQVQIQATDALMECQTYSTGPVDSWLTSFVAWAANSTEYSRNVGTSGGYSVYEDYDTFYAALANFTEDGDNKRFQSDIVFNDDGEIEISRSTLYLIDVIDTTSNVDALQDTRDAMGQSTLEPEPFGYSGIFVFAEQFLVIYEELITNFSLALVAVAVLSMIVLGEVVVVVLVCLTVVMIDVELLGFIYHWNLDVNSITVIELIMAVGLVVDYTVHIVHYYLHQDSDTPKSTRIAKALGEIGPSVLLGAATTFLGIVPLAFATNAVFRVFFKMFLVIITFGLFHGIVFIPVALSLVPDCRTSFEAGKG